MSPTRGQAQRVGSGSRPPTRLSSLPSKRPPPHPLNSHSAPLTFQFLWTGGPTGAGEPLALLCGIGPGYPQNTLLEGELGRSLGWVTWGKGLGCRGRRVRWAASRGTGPAWSKRRRWSGLIDR